MKVRITKGTMKAYLTSNIFHFSEMPDFIELEGEPVDEILVTCCIRCKYTGCSNIGCKCHSKSTWVSNEDIDKAATQLTPTPCGVPEKLVITKMDKIKAKIIKLCPDFECKGAGKPDHFEEACPANQNITLATVIRAYHERSDFPDNDASILGIVERWRLADDNYDAQNEQTKQYIGSLLGL